MERHTFRRATLLKVALLLWVFFSFLKLYKCYQIKQRMTYNTTLAITGALSSGISREKLYQELGIESLQQRRC